MLIAPRRGITQPQHAHPPVTPCASLSHLSLRCPSHLCFAAAGRHLLCGHQERCSYTSATPALPEPD
eukprot:2957022-Prymnesium_polylepis.2